MQGGGILEVAHNFVMPNQRACKCGRNGCLENYISPCLVKGVAQPEAMKEMIELMAITMYNMANIFRSEKIILTGRLARYRAYFECYFLN